MSLWVNTWRCIICSTEMNITGGMVGTTWMGPVGEVNCPNENCNAVWGRTRHVHTDEQGISFTVDDEFEMINHV